MQEAEFRDAVARHRDTVFRLAYTYMRDAADANDVAQDVFVKLLRHNGAFESVEHLRNWLIRVTINTCKSLFRRPWRRIEDIEDYAEQLAMPTQEHADLFVQLMCLPEKYRVPLETQPSSTPQSPRNPSAGSFAPPRARPRNKRVTKGPLGIDRGTAMRLR